VRKRLKVEYGVTALEHRGTSRDISVGGLFLMGERVYKVGTRLHLNVVLTESHFYAEGLVMHNKRVQASLRRIETQGMGLRFLNTSELVRKLVPQSMRRVDTIAVRCGTQSDLQRLMQEQLKAGVLVVPVADPIPAINAVVEFEVQLEFSPEMGAIRGTGRVIQVLGSTDQGNLSAVLEIQNIVQLVSQLEYAL
jgi:hypothetical protein